MQPDAQLPFALADDAEIAENTSQWQARWQPQVRSIDTYRVIDQPTLTMAIIAFKSKAFLIDAVRCARACPVPPGHRVEVVVADCGGIDELRPELNTLCDRIFTLTPGIAVNPARNTILAFAAGDLVALLDDDGEVELPWVQNVLPHFDDPRTLALRGKIVFKNHRYFTALARHYDRGPVVVDDSLAVEGNIVVRRGAYYRSGGMVSDFWGGEGSWLSYALIKAFPGGRVLYAPDVVMRHDFHQTWGHFMRKSMSFAGMLEQIAASYPNSDEFLAYLRQEWERAMPTGTQRLDERLARIGLLALRQMLRGLAKFKRRIQRVDRESRSLRQ